MAIVPALLWNPRPPQQALRIEVCEGVVVDMPTAQALRRSGLDLLELVRDVARITGERPDARSIEITVEGDAVSVDADAVAARLKAGA